MNSTDIQQWLVHRVAHHLQRPADEISPTEKLRNYGLDSIYALALADDVEETFRIKVDPTLAWEHPTIESIAGYLADHTAYRTS